MQSYKQQIAESFFNDLKNIKNLQKPQGYLRSYEPNLMQKRVSTEIKKRKHLLNYSDMGSGKTLSSIYSSRILNCKYTLIICPNSVISTWKKEIEETFTSCEIVLKTFNPNFISSSPWKYLILNYEIFQQENSQKEIESFIINNLVNFVCIDEVHRAKVREKKAISIRRKNLMFLRTSLQEKNKDLYVLTMSGTPIINELTESKSIIELTTGVEENLGTSISVPNIMRHHQRLSTIGVRYVPKLSINKNISIIDVDASVFGNEIKECFNLSKTPILELEKIFTRAKLDTILNSISKGEKTIIYNHYINGQDEKIKEILANALKEKGFTVGFWDGEDDENSTEFKNNGDCDVLLISSASSTGVDGLQKVCNKLIINILPWTSADYEQLIARLFRTGQDKDVKIIIPLSYLKINNQEWSYDKYKWDIIQWKGDLATAVIDGNIPEGEIITKNKALEYLRQWLKRIEEKGINDLQKKIFNSFDFEDEISFEENVVDDYKDKKCILPKKFPDSDESNNLIWNKIQNKWSVSNNQTIADRYKADSTEWFDYHKKRNIFIKSWDKDPCHEIINIFQKYEFKLTIGDFGCGEAKIASELKNQHKIYSFDFIAVNENVTAGDMSKTNLPNQILKHAVFCLSLITQDCVNALYEAHRCLEQDGFLHIIEPISKIENIDLFVDSINSIGFTDMPYKKIGIDPEFIYFKFVKDKKLNSDIKLIWK